MLNFKCLRVFQSSGTELARQVIVMKLNDTKILRLLPIFAIAFPLAACDVDKVEDGEMPEVKGEGEAKLAK